MTVVTYEITVTHRYLMNKSKSDLRYWFEEQCRELMVRIPHDDFTKEDYAYRIMRNIGILERMDKAKADYEASGYPAKLLAAHVHE